MDEDKEARILNSYFNCIYFHFIISFLLYHFVLALMIFIRVFYNFFNVFKVHFGNFL